MPIPSFQQRLLEQIVWSPFETGHGWEARTKSPVIQRRISVPRLYDLGTVVVESIRR